MSKYGFNPKELRKTIVTRIDKDGFHERTVEYANGSGESSDSDTSMIARFKSDVIAACGYPENTVCVAVFKGSSVYNIGDGIDGMTAITMENVSGITSPQNKLAIISMNMEIEYNTPYEVYALDSNYVVLDKCSITITQPLG